MGSGIAHVAALAGYEVRLTTSIARRRWKRRSRGIDKNIARQVARGKATEDDKAAALKRITTGTEFRVLQRMRRGDRGRDREAKR